MYTRMSIEISCTCKWHSVDKLIVLLADRPPSPCSHQPTTPPDRAMTVMFPFSWPSGYRCSHRPSRRCWDCYVEMCETRRRRLRWIRDTRPHPPWPQPWPPTTCLLPLLLLPPPSATTTTQPMHCITWNNFNHKHYTFNLFGRDEEVEIITHPTFIAPSLLASRFIIRRSSSTQCAIFIREFISHCVALSTVYLVPLSLLRFWI